MLDTQIYHFVKDFYCFYWIHRYNAKWSDKFECETSLILCSKKQFTLSFRHKIKIGHSDIFYKNMDAARRKTKRGKAMTTAHFADFDSLDINNARECRANASY